ncbi:MAG: ABC transporter substrate-binding protein, partial [Terriglobales bacterium]
PQRDLLSVGGRPVRCVVINAGTVELDLPAPLAVGDRLFDSLWMLPRHALQASYLSGKLGEAWGLGTPANQIVGLGGFRLESFEPGREVTLARNPAYWRRDGAGRALPYLERLRLPVVSDPNLRLTLFIRGQVDGLDSVGSEDFARLAGRACCRLLDGGAGLNSEVLVFNQAPAAAAPARAWFRQGAFRQAVSLALDRKNLVRSVYAGHAAELASLTSPGDKLWADPTPPAQQNLGAARALLRQAGFHWQQAQLVGPDQRPVTFSLIVPASNAARSQIAVFVQEDLRRLGMAVQVVPLEFASYVDRLQHRDDFEAALVGIQIPDADPNVEGYLWTLDGAGRFWNPHPAAPAAWERDLDHWFQAQLGELDPSVRHADYRRMQAIEREQLPLIPLVAPDILMAVAPGLEGVAPALLPPHLLWNAEQLRWR